ncbi:ankyrin repeat, SAM and basic leucine zipper domain-containing protein 1 [Rhincodon typus]|uniref:ankyrin repeat, SAM and basic leucine zipper domain-containing protein 1 n=1 Tax=Rhincodon typus TaxID=259920 RepID=UPI00202F3BFC|nr:ankyrin repeat, SAM and basic leucine zipper domain-containing protein 1 [Rhincodon typus]
MLFKPATTHCNMPELRRKKEEHMYKDFANNGYPSNFIRRCLLDRQCLYDNQPARRGSQQPQIPEMAISSSHTNWWNLVVKTSQVKTSSEDESSLLGLSKNNKKKNNDKDTGTLKEALASQKLHLVEQLLNSGLDVETRFGFGWTPLMYAASIANFEITRLLLNRGANASFANGSNIPLVAVMIKITDPDDQRKILEAVCEMQPEDLQVAQLPSLDNFDCSSEELTKFLIKLKKHCGHLKLTVQNVANQLSTNSELRVLDVDPDQKSALACDDLVKCIQDLDKEVQRLRNLLLKLQNDQEQAPSRVPALQSYFRPNQFLKKVAIGLFGTGFIYSLIKLRVLRN